MKFPLVGHFEDERKIKRLEVGIKLKLFASIAVWLKVGRSMFITNEAATNALETTDASGPRDR